MRTSQRTPRRSFPKVSAILLALVAGVALTLAPEGASATSLQIQVENLRSGDGNIVIALYDSEDSFLDSERHVIIARPESADAPLEVVFDNLPPGDYAVAAFHDENESGDFDTNFLGIPKEGYGFSNGARAGLGPSDFDEAAVRVTAFGTTRTALPLTY